MVLLSIFWDRRRCSLLKQKHQRELADLRHSNASLAEQLKQKKLELSYLALSSVQKSEFMEQQQLGIEILAKNYPADQQVRQLLHAWYFQDITQRDWENFKTIFAEIAPDFFEKIAQLNCKLTIKEIRHCALLKLNVSSEDAASLLGISVSSVYKAKYRLRKKLALESEQSLEDFIVSI